MKEIRFFDQSMILHHAGILFWPAQKCAVVSDLHLEKGSYFGLTGQFLPPFESYETLKKLDDVITFSDIETLILLGDTIHDEAGFARLDEHSKTLFNQLCDRYDVIWIIGNHDGGFIPPKTKGQIELEIDNIVFRHEAEKELHNKGEISGHYHPKIAVKAKGQKITRPCFIEDGQRMIMPSFGSFTGGLDVTDPAIENYFDKKTRKHLLSRDKVFSL